MAYVAISNGLISSTERNIRNMRDKEKETRTAPPEQGTVPDEDGNMTALIWGDHHHLRNQLPDNWKHNPGRVTLRCGFKLNPEDEKGYSVDYQVTAPSGFESPCTSDNHSSYYGYIVKVDEHNHLLPAGAKELIEHRKFCREIDNRWADVESKVRQFLNASKSLNEAIKVWPGVSLYVNKEYLDRVNDKVVRGVRPKSDVEQLAASIDLDSLTAAAVASKLTV